MAVIIAPTLVIDHALRDAGIPITGISVGTLTDRTTWHAFYAAAATDAQRAQGDVILATIDPQDPITIASIKAEVAAAIDADLLIQAVAQVDFEERQKLTVKAGQALLTAAQTKARVKAIYLSLL